MTEDTRRALQIIEPIMDELGVEVETTDRPCCLYLDGQPIGIGCNSTYATVMEALGWLFLERYTQFRDVEITSDLEEDVTRYWASPEAVKKMLEIVEGKV